MKKSLFMIAASVLFNSSAMAAPSSLDGHAIFQKNCTQCHSLTPPPKLAPPLIPLVYRYHLKFKTKPDGMKHLVAFLKLPNKKHALDQQAITKFGLMARLPLSDKELRAVAEWAWDHSSSPVGSGT